MTLSQDKKNLQTVLSPWTKREDCTLYLAILSHQFNHIFQHSERVAHYAVLLAKAIGCSADEISTIGAAAMLHDIGKINVPIKVLYKQGVYTENDRAEMERHSVYGYQMLLRSKDLRELATIVLCHHERYDGSGYPKGLQKLEIPLAARIIHIAEAFDVMTTIQNYQQLKKGEQALAELERLAGSQFDETLVKAFIGAKAEIIAEIKTETTVATSQEERQPVLASNGIMCYMQNIANLGIICLDKYNTVVFCNSYAEEMRQLPVGSLLGKNFLDCYPRHRHKILEGKLTQLRTGEKNEWYRLMGRGSKFIENRYSRVIDEQGNFVGTVLVTIDVTEREVVSRSLSAALERQAALYQAAQIITSALSIDEVLEGILRIIKRSIVVNQATIYLLHEKDKDTSGGYEKNSKSNASIFGQDCHNAAEKLRNTLQTVTVDDEKNNLTKWYVPIIYRTELLGILYVERISQGENSLERVELLETLASQTAIAIRNARLYEEVTYLAEHDKLTGLLNRHSFDRFFADYCQSNKVQLIPFTVVMIDIDGLKPVNDQYGHVAGDMLISAAAQIVKNSIRTADRAFRYGGDEIVVVMPDMTLGQAHSIIKRIQRNVNWWKPKSTYANLALSVSVGAADSGEIEAECLLKEADKRMYENKRIYDKRSEG